MISNLEDLNKNIDNLKRLYSKESGKKEKILEQMEKVKKEINEIDSKIDLLEEVNLLLQKTSEFAREQSKKQIETLVTNCLQYVFENDMEFNIDIVELRNKPNAEFYVISRYGTHTIKTKPELSRGGGVVDVISLALRIAFMQIYRPQICGPLILDEPAKHVSEEYIFNVADFLQKTSEMFNKQIIMVTHNNYLSSIGTNAYRVELKGSESIVRKITPD
ncbi:MULTISPECIES: ATPase [Tissierellales]|jgi:DNA repair exonuclease SbcCD ATPase subunit|uniref:ATPase n=1 Tax=Acidilutibacter cellobiosedens TaxID=2507161 RepID=A0A410QCB8_9FIRM|nr:MULTISPECIES: ATPase [Tissierellales]MBE6081691.1 ATPase [Tissierellaceae bacterium]QAT61673.1 ATPase [Acidilutibacter cellobiosedens]SCL82826.1 chromosome segregation protein [Sporanaerobacter sp. PP17-6a]